MVADPVIMMGREGTSLFQLPFSLRSGYMNRSTALTSHLANPKKARNTVRI